MNVVPAARALALGRAGIGAAMLLAPRQVARRWIGGEAENAGALALTRSLGVRDLLLGLMAMHTLGHPQVAARWQATLAGVDAVDAMATAAGAGELPLGGVIGTVALAGGAAAAELWFARTLRAS